MKRFTLFGLLAVLLLGFFGTASSYQIPLPPLTQAVSLASLRPPQLLRWAARWRTPLGPGLVRWHLPADGAAGYSVLTEDRERLAWAETSPAAVDAIYRRAWGCGLALKIPDSCSVDVYPDHMSASCNLLAAQFGNVPHWVAPGQNHESAWPPCPLPSAPHH